MVEFRDHDKVTSHICFCNMSLFVGKILNLFCFLTYFVPKSFCSHLLLDHVNSDRLAGDRTGHVPHQAGRSTTQGRISGHEPVLNFVTHSRIQGLALGHAPGCQERRIQNFYEIGIDRIGRLFGQVKTKIIILRFEIF